MVITGLIKKQYIACEKTSGFDRKIHEHINESSYLVTLANIRYQQDNAIKVSSIRDYCYCIIESRTVRT